MEQPSADLKSHIVEHIKTWPATKADIVAACEGMSDIEEGEKKKFESMLPEGTYENPDAVFKAMDEAMKNM